MYKSYGDGGRETKANEIYLSTNFLCHRPNKVRYKFDANSRKMTARHDPILRTVSINYICYANGNLSHLPTWAIVP